MLRQFTLDNSGDDDDVIYINVDHIVSIQENTTRGNSMITFAGINNHLTVKGLAYEIAKQANDTMAIPHLMALKLQ